MTDWTIYPEAEQTVYIRTVTAVVECNRKKSLPFDSGGALPNRPNEETGPVLFYACVMIESLVNITSPIPCLVSTNLYFDDLNEYLFYMLIPMQHFSVLRIFDLRSLQSVIWHLTLGEFTDEQKW